MAGQSELGGKNIVDLRARVEAMRKSMVQSLGPTFTGGATAIGVRLCALAELIDELISSEDPDAEAVAALSEIALKLAEVHLQMVLTARTAFLGAEPSSKPNFDWRRASPSTTRQSGME